MPSWDELWISLWSFTRHHTVQVQTKCVWWKERSRVPCLRNAVSSWGSRCRSNALGQLDMLSSFSKGQPSRSCHREVYHRLNLFGTNAWYELTDLNRSYDVVTFSRSKANIMSFWNLLSSFISVESDRFLVQTLSRFCLLFQPLQASRAVARIESLGLHQIVGVEEYFIGIDVHRFNNSQNITLANFLCLEAETISACYAECVTTVPTFLPASRMTERCYVV